MNTPTTKQCHRCKEEKPVEAFTKNKTRLGGLQHWCRACIAADRQAWSADKKERRKQYYQAYHQKHRAVMQAQNAKYRAEHREHLMRLDREKYARIREERFAAGLSRVVRKETPALIECAKCHEMKPRVGFYRMSKYSSKYTSYCRLCMKGMGAQQYQETRERELARGIVYRLRTKYGMTPADFDTMLQRQQNQCAICQREFLRTSSQNMPKVDHDHATGKVREILCDNCNKALGYAQDDLSLLRKMIAYLEKHGVPA